MTRQSDTKAPGLTRRRFSFLSLLLAVGVVLPLLSGPLAAQSLDDLRAAGKVGERFDGFAVARDSALADQVAAPSTKSRPRNMVFPSNRSARSMPARSSSRCPPALGF